MKSFLFIFLFFLLTTTISALEFGAFPEEIELEGSKGERVCKTISVKSSEEIILSVEDKWSEEKSRMLKDYSKSSEIQTFYPQNVMVSGNERVEFCFEGNKETNYGVLLLKPEGYPTGIGVWVEINLGGRSFSDTISHITGETVGKVSQSKTEVSYLIGSSLFLLAVLLFLIFKMKKSKPSLV